MTHGQTTADGLGARPRGDAADVEVGNVISPAGSALWAAMGLGRPNLRRLFGIERGPAYVAPMPVRVRGFSQRTEPKRRRRR